MLTLLPDLNQLEEGVLYTINRDLLYKGSDNKQVNIPCDIIHAQLKLAENTAREALLARDPEYKGNLATANIGFVVSSHPYDAAHKTHGRHFITVPLHFAVDWDDPNKKHFLTAQIRDLWGDDETTVATETKGGKDINKKRNPMQLKRQERANRYASKDGLNFDSSYDGYDFSKYYQSAGPKLENDFHHSEQTIYEILENPDAISYYINNFLRAYKVKPGDKVYAIILDIHTTRYMCQGCAGRAYAIAHYPGRGLLVKWEKKLLSLGYRVPKTGLRMAIRVTGEGPAHHQDTLHARNYKKQLSIWTLNPGRQNINSIVMEADARHLPIPFAPYEPINDLFRRTVFLSKETKSDSSYIQEAAIETFRAFLLRFQANHHNICNPMFAQTQTRNARVRNILDTLNPKIRVPIPVEKIKQEHLAQNIYLPGQPNCLTGTEFRGLFFI